MKMEDTQRLPHGTFKEDIEHLFLEENWSLRDIVAKFTDSLSGRTIRHYLTEIVRAAEQKGIKIQARQPSPNPLSISLLQLRNAQ